MVWLAPGEQFMPGNVNDFLHHVHAEKGQKPSTNKDEPVDLNDDIYYYEVGNGNELSSIVPPDADIANVGDHEWPAPVRRNKRMFKDNNFLLDYIIDLPIGKRSLNWFLVTNDKIGNIGVYLKIYF